MFLRIAHYARVVKSVDTRDLNNLSLRGETPGVKPVKIGESPGCFCTRANAEPSPSNSLGRCREQTAGTYGRKAMVKACSRPRTAHALAAKAEVVRKSLAERRAGSIPASGTNSGAASVGAEAAIS